MTKQKAFDIAFETRKKGMALPYEKVRNSSIEIYAAAFAEWVKDDNFFFYKGQWQKIAGLGKSEKNYTTAELIKEFEKL